MTDAQKTTAKQIVTEYKNLFQKKPTPVDMGDRIIYIQRNGPILHPHYKIVNNGNILFGIGTEYTQYGMPVIGINSWNIIQPNGAIVDKSLYSDFELQLTQQPVELSGFSGGGDLIRF
jgi:hypothetical protein